MGKRGGRVSVKVSALPRKRGATARKGKAPARMY